MIDLHTHTTFSDGSLDPTQLIDKAINLGLKAIAITDHDTIDALDMAIKYGKQNNLLVIPGVEIEIEYEGPGEFHLLGLGIENYKGQLSKALFELKDFRNTRNNEIIRRLNADDIDINLEEVKKVAGSDIIGRPHFSQILINKGYAKDTHEAFNKYLNIKSKYFVKKKSFELEKAINLIHSANGVAIMAHPQTLYLSWSKFEATIKNYKEMGLDGIEAWHGGLNKIDCTRYESIASKLRLIVSGGSDYHGDNIKERILGLGAGGRSVPEIFLNNIVKGGIN